MNKVISTIAILLVSFSLFAQEDKMEKDKDFKEKMEQIQNAKIAFFTTEINLTPAEAEVFWPIYNQFTETVRNAHKETRRSFNELTKLKEKGGYTDAQMKQLIDHYIECWVAEGKVQEDYLARFYSVLPVDKVASMYMAEEGFRMKMIKMWERPKDGKGDRHNDEHSGKNRPQPPVEQ